MMTNTILIIIILVIWERTCNYLLNIERYSKMTQSTILLIEHISLVTVGFIAGAILFYFKSNQYNKLNNIRLFTKDEVKEVVNIALEENNKVKQ